MGSAIAAFAFALSNKSVGEFGNPFGGEDLGGGEFWGSGIEPAEASLP